MHRHGRFGPTWPLAVVAGKLLTGLADVTDDPAALDSSGFWAVVITFEGKVTCARFTDVRPAVPWPGRRWHGPSPDAWHTSLAEADFKAGVDQIRSVIADGGVYQVNLTRVLSAPATPEMSIPALGAALAEGNPAPFAAVVHLPGHGVHVASASPELFLARRGDHVWSSPIKGTAKRPELFLPKDAAENVMIVDLVRNDLGRVCRTGTVNVPSLLATEPHPGLFHLVSTVEGRLVATAGWPELIEATFPPGSVTGAPKLASLEVVRRLEPTPRGVYCGAVGWVDADRQLGELNVAIRTFWIADDQLRFGTGGGITYDSDPAGEWAETELKAANLLRVASRR